MKRLARGPRMIPFVLALAGLAVALSSASAQTSRQNVFQESVFAPGPGGPAPGRTAAARGYVPKHVRTSYALQDEPMSGAGPMEMMPRAQPEPVAPPASPMAESYLYDDMSMLHEGGAACGHAGCGVECCEALPCGAYCWDGCEAFAGVQGFTGPVNRGSTGSFGFHQGVNLGTPLQALFGDAVSGQLGVRTTQSNFNEAEFTMDERHQVFVTGGLFRRVDWGLQGGLVVDYFHEGYYFDADWVQLRGELSWVFPCEHELGFWFAANDQQQTVDAIVRDGFTTTAIQETYDSTDLYAFFYRHRDDCSGTTWRTFVGFTGDSDALIGSEILAPINDSWGLRAGYTYLIPHEGGARNGFEEEAWNVGISLVWRPNGGFTRPTYFQPLFDVASNGTFLIDRQ